MAKEDPIKIPDRVISVEEFAKGWDTERRIHELNPLSFNLKGSTMYVPSRTKSDMDEAHGGPTPAIRTRTFPGEYRAWISPCAENAPGARKLRPSTDTHGTAEFGFGIPLRKLGIKVPETRQYTFEATRLLVEGGGIIYEISFRDFENRKRDVDEAALAAEKQAKAEKKKARRSRTAGGAAASNEKASGKEQQAASPDTAAPTPRPATETAAGQDEPKPE